jgi:tripartite-type tricarboxylate transporter receptor subunit TctC
MPADLLARLSHDFAAAANLPAIKARLAGMGATSIGTTPQQFDAVIHADYDKWGPIIKAAGIQPE